MKRKLFFLPMIIILLLVPALNQSMPTVKAESKGSEETETDIDEIIANMSQKEKFGQLIMPDFRNWTVNGKEVPLTEMNDEVGKVISDYKLGGVILFRENVANTEQTVRLTDGMQKSVSNGIPLMITIDQEGGLVTRLQKGTNMPGNMALGAASDPELTREVSKAIGEEIHSLGININFAPSVDVNSNYLNPVIGIRSFGSDADLVSQMGVSYIKGQQDAQVAGAAKHFPGHGDTATDSHFGLPVVEKSLEEFKAVDLKPFEAAVDAGVDMLMTAHIVVPALDDNKIITEDGTKMGTPATLSKNILTDLVRDEMGYDGIVITDALNMQAISDNFTEPETVVKTLSAGADIALMPTSIRKPNDVTKLDAIYDALDDAVKSGIIPQEQIDKSVHRVLTLKKDREIIDSKDTRTLDDRIDAALNIVGSEAHKDTERRAAEKAVTLIKNDNETLPFRLEDNTTVQILASYDGRSNLMELQMNNIIEKHGMENVDVNQHVFKPEGSLTDEDKALIDEADYVVMETMNLSSSSVYAPEVVDYSNETNANLAVMSTRNPYDIMYMEDVKANIAVYGSSGYDQTQQGEAALPINIPTGIDVIFGEANPGGKLPVSIPKVDGEGNLYEFGHGLSYTKSYDDVSKDNAHYESIQALTAQDVFRGYETNQFKPWENISREHMAVILSKINDYKEPENIEETLQKYKDVDSQSRYAKEIAMLTEANVFSGDEDGNFNPKETITRQQMATVLVYAMSLDQYDHEESVDINLDNVSLSHKENVQTLANFGLTNQLDDFRPYEPITRAAVATLVYKAQSAAENF